MRKTILILLLAVFLGLNVLASETKKTSVTLCFNGEAYSAEYVYDVKNADRLSVEFEDIGALHDWNYVEEEARLYISFASSKALAKSERLATIYSGEDTVLQLLSLTVNSGITENVFGFHTAVEIPGIAPTCDKFGLTVGAKCEKCGLILVEQQYMEPLGPTVRASLSANQTLRVSAVLSDNPKTEGLVLLAVYDTKGRLLISEDISSYDQSDIKLDFEHCEKAATVKIFRFDSFALRPTGKVVECVVDTL